MLNNAKAALESQQNVKIGDVNQDGDITVSDIVMLRIFISNESIPNEIQMQLSDTNESGDLTVADIVGLRVIMAG
jgi:hypothetical protein